MKNRKTFSHFLIMWSGQLISSIGSGLTAFALGIYIFQQTGSAINYSLVILAAFLPSFIFKPIGGTLSDRVNRRSLMVVGELGSALGLIFIILTLHQGITQLWPIYLGTMISSIFVAFQNPAYKASITDLVEEKNYSKASGLMQLAESSKYIISPILAGILLKLVNIKMVLLIDALTFLLAILTILWISVDSSAEKKPNIDNHFLADFMSGFKYFIYHRDILCLLLITSIVTFFIGLYQALLGPMVLAFANSQIFGTSVTISASGMLISSLLMGIFGKSTNKIAILSIGLFLNGIFFSLIGISINIVLVTFFSFLFFFALPFVNTSLDVLIRSNVDNNMQGRIWSIVSLISQSGMAIAFLIAGYLADKVFNPLLQADGVLSSSIGLIIGTGNGRGIGLIFILSGLFVSIIGLIISRVKIIKRLSGKKDNTQGSMALT